MIHIKIKKKDQIFKTITLKGHAMYETYGKDIVCAGVSSILTTTINGILMLQKDAIIYHQEQDNFVLEIKSKDETTQTLILNMVLLFQELEEKYKKNITVESEE